LRIKTIALAHHADDQVELFFVRMLRGAGAEGLAGMTLTNPSPIDPRLTLIRPLLDQPKSVLLKHSLGEGIRYREDATNASLDMLRNRVRNELIPLLKRHYQRALAKVILRQVEILSEESQFMRSEAARCLKERQASFDTLPIALQRHCLRLQLFDQGVSADFEQVERLRQSANTSITVGPELRVWRDQLGRIHKEMSQRGRGWFQGRERTINLANGKGKASFAGVQLRWSLTDGGNRNLPKTDRGCEWFDADRVGQVIRLRHWREGDRFQPSGMTKGVKLQNLFTNAKIPKARRHRLVVATTESGEIWWVEGLRIGERFKLTMETMRRLKWEWTREA
jgi:tRNA(Ile)-lysidine synthase